MKNSKNTLMSLVTLVSFFFIGCGTSEDGVEAPVTAETAAEETAAEETAVVEVSKELTAFSITSPTSSTASATVKPTITWSESDYADSTTLSLVEDVTYDLTITSDAACTTAIQTYSDLTVLTKTLDTALAEGTFYVCINSKSQGEVKSATNNAFKIAVDLLPQDFTLAAVTSTSATGASHSISLSWGASTNASYYLVTTDSTQNTTQVTTTSSTISVTATARAGTSYSVLVTAYDAAGNSKASNTVTFTAARLYALSDLTGSYTVNNGNSLAKTGTYDADMLLGVQYSCTNGTNTYLAYQFSDAFVITLSSSNMEVDLNKSNIEGFGYTCTTI